MQKALQDAQSDLLQSAAEHCSNPGSQHLLQTLGRVGGLLIGCGLKRLGAVQHERGCQAAAHRRQTCSPVTARPNTQVLDPEAHSASGSFANATQQCFAAKQGLSSLLDLARITFTQVTEQIHDLAARYRTIHQMPDLKVRGHQRHQQRVTAADAGAASRPMSLAALQQSPQLHADAGVVHSQEGLSDDLS